MNVLGARIGSCGKSNVEHRLEIGNYYASHRRQQRCIVHIISGHGGPRKLYMRFHLVKNLSFCCFT